MREDAERFLRMARKDLGAATYLLTAPAPDGEIVGFHFQQAVEKSLKAWLALLNIAFPNTHNLRYLIDRLAEAQCDVQALDQFIILTPFAVQFRYEAYDGLDHAFEKAQMQQSITSFVNHIESLLNP